MIRTIVVDDEPFIRQYITNSICSQNDSFQIIGQAGDGETAWNMINEHKPDVVFLDIKMPLLDGLEVLKLCKTLRKPPICVILSGYSDFSFAQEAIKLNVFEYILKPINQKNIKAVLDNIVEYIYLKKQSVQNEFFSQLLHNYPHSHSNQDIEIAFVGTRFYYTYYLCIGSFSTYHYNQFDVLGNFWNKINFDSTVSSFIPEHESIWILHEETKNECFIIHGLEEENNTQFQSLLTKLLNFIDGFPYPVTFLYGATTSHKEDLRNQFIELTNAAKNYAIFADTVILDINDNIKQEPSNLLPFSEQQLLSDLVTEQKFVLFHKQFDICLDECENNKCTQRKLNAVLKRVCEIANNNYIPLSIIEQIDELTTNTSLYSDIKKGLHDILNDIFHSFPDNTSSTSVMLIKEYIDNHYTELISLSLLAEKFSFSISYLSTLFKKNYQISPNEYIIKLRMERAKILLSDDSDTSIRQIAESIGYSDPYYFSRLFKMTTGKTPSAYRNALT